MSEFRCPSCAAIFERLVERAAKSSASPCCKARSRRVMSAPKTMTVWLSAVQGKSDPAPNAKSIDWVKEIGSGRSPMDPIKRVRKIGRDKRLMQVLKRTSRSG